MLIVLYVGHTWNYNQVKICGSHICADGDSSLQECGTRGHTLRSRPPPLPIAHYREVPPWTTLNLEGTDSSATFLSIYKVYRASYPKKLQSSILKSPNNLRWTFTRYSPAPRIWTVQTTRCMESALLSHVNFIHYTDGTCNLSLHVSLLKKFIQIDTRCILS